MIIFNCPKCDRSLEAPESMAGDSGKCEWCSARITVPSPPANRPRVVALAVVLLLCVVGGALVLLAVFGGGDKTSGAAEKPAGAVQPSRAAGNAAQIASADSAQTPDGVEPFAKEAFEKSSPAVVTLRVVGADGKELRRGSGFFISPDGLIVTNYMVVMDGHGAVATMRDGRTFDVEGVVAFERQTQMIILKVAGSGLPFLKPAPTELPEIGLDVIAIGGQSDRGAPFIAGQVDDVSRYSDTVVQIQTTAKFDMSFTGGPLVDRDGAVVGVLAYSRILPAFRDKAPTCAFPASWVGMFADRPEEIQPLSSYAKLERGLFEAQLAGGREEWSKAKRTLLGLKRTHPNEPLIWKDLGWIYRRMGENDLAMDAFDTLIALRPVSFDGYRGRAATLWSTGRWREAIEACRRYVAVVAPDGGALGYEFMGFIYHTQRQLPDAIKAYDKAVSLRPDLVTAWQGLADVYRDAQDFEQEIRVWTEALALRPAAEAYARLGRAYAQLADYRLAKRAFKKAIKTDPNDPVGYSDLGSLLFQLGDYDGAAKAYTEAIHRDPGKPHLYLARSMSRLSPDDRSYQRTAIVVALAKSAVLEVAEYVRAQSPAARCQDQADRIPWRDRGNWRKLRVGMSETEVTRLLGPPTGRASAGRVVLLSYGGYTVTVVGDPPQVTGWQGPIR
ncbi:hypothetical protein LCGC14_0254350 [marine sediment metagenome]|uniref:Uncharacterized protein n=1 Tax=marine sediment metagenome TaxID=412755 RepID=A0A0F9U8I7_9ZZZZ|nr:serine protease [Phycisphaerae bacterium]HDZ45067.1 serine protease [Phycisphaerae bacterium]